MASPRRPVTGMRLTYELTMGGAKFLVGIKESIGNWLGIKPVAPGTGTFKKGPAQGKKYALRPGGFRYQSFTILLRRGVTITEVLPGCNNGGTRERELCTFDLGMPRGNKDARVAVWRVQSWALNTKQSKNIIGLVSPSGTQRVWRNSDGELLEPSNPLDPILPDLPDLPGLPDFDIPLIGNPLDPSNPLSPLNPNSPLNPGGPGFPTLPGF